MVASQIRSWGSHPPKSWVQTTIKNMRVSFKQFATEAIGLSHYLPDGSLFVNYNKWFADKKYRAKIATSLGLSHGDKAINFVSNHGAGSSFNRRKYNGKAQKMDVLNRWETYAGNEFYMRIFDDEMNKLSEKLFGPMPPISKPTTQNYKHTDPKQRHYLENPDDYIK